MSLSTKLNGMIFALILCSAMAVGAQETTPPTTADEREALYTEVLARRVDGIMQRLALTDTNKAYRVRNALLLQYRTLRLRDEAIDVKLGASGKDSSDLKARADVRRKLSAPLHEWFFSMLSIDLTPAQVEVIKDEMTYHKVKVTFDAYCQIIPNLTEADKAKVMELLKVAREEAVDGGSAPEKSAIFQVYKDQINAHLTAAGHDVAKAFADWEAKQAAQQASSGK
jgi:hypothetical protein